MQMRLRQVKNACNLINTARDEVLSSQGHVVLAGHGESLPSADYDSSSPFKVTEIC